MTNILFLGGGRRVTLAEEFIKRGYKVLSYEATHKAPISSVAPVILGLKWDNPNIMNHISSMACAYSIELIVPLQDEAVKVLASYKEQIPTFSLVGSKDSAVWSLDKWLYSTLIYQYLREYYIPTQLITYNWFTGDITNLLKDSGCIIKPRAGFRSQGISIIRSKEDIFEWVEEINPFLADQPTFPSGEYIIQKFIKGVEFTVDGYISPKKGFIDAVPRIRLRVDGGEVVTSKTVDYPELVHATCEIGKRLGIVGPYNVQFIVDVNGHIYTTETNARFGGGSTLSLNAGLDFIGLIGKDYFNKYFNYKVGSWQ
jgi:hypothetical protein